MNKINLSDSEWKIMKVLWAHSPCTLKELVTELEGETGWTKATVFTMLKRLIAKDAVTMEDDGTHHQYSPAISRKDAAITETASFLSRVYDGSVGLMISALTSRQSLSEEDIAELHKILDEAEKKQRG